MLSRRQVFGEPRRVLATSLAVSPSLSCTWGTRWRTWRVVGDNGMLSQPAATIQSGRRFFFSGLDESRVSRLRRSGMTFNKPRGRDHLSLAFEKRIAICTYSDVGELYLPPKVTAATGGSDSIGSSERAAVIVGVVDPIPLDAVHRPVLFPSAHPPYYDALWKSPASLVGSDGGRCAAAGVAHQSSASGSESFGYMPFRYVVQSDAAEVLSVEAGDTGAGASVPSEAEELLLQGSFAMLPPKHRRYLRQGGDTAMLASSTLRSIGDSGVLNFFTVLCVDPVIDVAQFRREEAEVEMISAYRNILFEAAEYRLPRDLHWHGAPCRSPSASAEGRSSHHGHSQPLLTSVGEISRSVTHYGLRPRRGPIDVLRIPALSVHTCGDRFRHEIGKLNQQSLIKGFHRVSNEAKELLLSNDQFRVELYVPQEFIGQFEAAFLEDAWETPHSSLNPGRTALYPGLAPPRTLLQYDGWVGNRPELVEAIETNGKSLLRGPHYNLDGTEIVEQEVLPGVSMFGGDQARKKRLELERATGIAAQQQKEKERNTDTSRSHSVSTHTDTNYFVNPTPLHCAPGTPSPQGQTQVSS